MYVKKRSWSSFGLMVLVLGIVLLYFVYLLRRGQDPRAVLIMALLGIIFTVAGAAVLVWDYRNRKRDTEGRADQSLTYTFTLITDGRREQVTDFAQIEGALAGLERTKKGTVEVKITPALAGISSVDCSYDPKKKYFYTYYLQEREDGQGYWFSIVDTTIDAKTNLKRMFVKHSKIDFRTLNRMETGERR